MSLNLRTVVFIVCTSLSFFLTMLYQKSRDFSNVRLSRRFKTCINEKQSIFQQKISTLKKALKNTKSPWKSRTFVCSSLFVLHRWARRIKLQLIFFSEILLRCRNVKWNLPTFASANISHLQSKYFTAKLFHLPEGQFSLKKALAFASAFFCVNPTILNLNFDWY